MNSFQIDGYQIDPAPIGEGCTGEVFQVKNLREKKSYIAKRYHSISIDRRLMESIFTRYREMPLHEGILSLKESRFDNAPYFSITENFGGRKLEECGPFKEEVAWFLIQNLASALGHAHRYGVVHGNLHPGNLLYFESDDGDIRIKVGDFGSGMMGEIHHIDLDETAYFAPPEQLVSLGRDYTNGKAEKWDVYRFGAVAFWMLNHTMPRGKLYQKLRAQELATSGGRPVPLDPVALGTIIEKDGKLPWKRKIGNGRKEARYKEIIENCLSLNPAKRPVDMRQVHNRFLDLEKEFTLLETEERAAAELAAAENRVMREKLKQKTKLFTARALVTILAAAVMIATFYLLEYLNLFKETRMKNNELGQVVTNLKAYNSILGNKVQHTTVDLKQSRAAADASFYSSMTLRDVDDQTATGLKELERSRTYYVKILKEASQQPDAAPERGRALHSLAHIEQKMSRIDESVVHFKKAIATFEEALDSNRIFLDDDHRQDTVARLADCYENLGMLNEKPGSDEALASLSKAIWYLKQVLVNEPGNLSAATRLAESSFYLGQTLDKQNRFEEAIDAYSAAAEKAVKLRSQTATTESRRELEEMISKLQFHTAEALQKIGRETESVDAYIATIESIERMRSIQGYSKEETLMMAKSFLALGDIFDEVEEIGGGDKDQVYNEALRLVVPLNRAKPDNVEIATLMAHSLARLARLELAANHRRDGYNLSVRGVEVLSTALESSPDDLHGYLQLAEARLGHLDFLTDNRTKARTISLRGVENAVKAHQIFVKTAENYSEPVRNSLDLRIRKLFSTYSTNCAELGQNETAAKCMNYATHKLSAKN